MTKENMDLNGKNVEIYVVPLKGVDLVFAKTAKGMIGCGLLDVMLLDRWAYPAAKMKGLTGLITSGQELLNAEAVVINESAKKLGIKEGMTGWEALKLL